LNVSRSLRDIAIRLSYLPEYQDIRDTYPFKGKSLRSFIEAAMSVDGPLKVAAKTAAKMLPRLDELEELRHRMAHAKMTLAPMRGFLFVDFDARKEKIVMRQMVLTPPQLIRFAQVSTRLSRWFQSAFSGLEAMNELPHHE